MPFYATVGPISLLDELHERFPCSEVAVLFATSRWR